MDQDITTDMPGHRGKVKVKEKVNENTQRSENCAENELEPDHLHIPSVLKEESDIYNKQNGF